MRTFFLVASSGAPVYTMQPAHDSESEAARRYTKYDLQSLVEQQRYSRYAARLIP